jgi:hypothetical protein
LYRTACEPLRALRSAGGVRCGLISFPLAANGENPLWPSVRATRRFACRRVCLTTRRDFAAVVVAALASGVVTSAGCCRLVISSPRPRTGKGLCVGVPANECCMVTVLLSSPNCTGIVRFQRLVKQRSARPDSLLLTSALSSDPDALGRREAVLTSLLHYAACFPTAFVGIWSPCIGVVLMCLRLDNVRAVAALSALSVDTACAEWSPCGACRRSTRGVPCSCLLCSLPFVWRLAAVYRALCTTGSARGSGTTTSHPMMCIG